MKYHDVLDAVVGYAVALPDRPESCGVTYSPQYVENALKSISEAMTLVRVAEYLGLPIDLMPGSSIVIDSDQDFSVSITFPVSMLESDSPSHSDLIESLKCLQAAWTAIRDRIADRYDEISKIIGTSIEVDMSPPRDALYLPASIDKKINALSDALRLIDSAEELSIALCYHFNLSREFEITERYGKVTLLVPDCFTGSGTLTYDKVRARVVSAMRAWETIREQQSSPAPNEVQQILREIGWVNDTVTLGRCIEILVNQRIPLEKPDDSAVYDPRVVCDTIYEVNVFLKLIDIAEKLRVMLVHSCNPDYNDISFVLIDLHEDHLVLRLPNDIRGNYAAVRSALTDLLEAWQMHENKFNQDVPDEIAALVASLSAAKV